MFIVLSYVKEPVQCLGQIPTGILHNPSRKLVSLHRIPGTICPWEELIFEEYEWTLQFKYYILVAVIPACIRQMEITHRSGICFGNLLWEVTVPLAKPETLDEDHFAGCRLLNLNPNVLYYIICCLHNMLLLFICNSQYEIENKIFGWWPVFHWGSESRTCIQTPETKQKPRYGLCF